MFKVSGNFLIGKSQEFGIKKVFSHEASLQATSCLASFSSKSHRTAEQDVFLEIATWQIKKKLDLDLAKKDHSRQFHRHSFTSSF